MIRTTVCLVMTGVLLLVPAAEAKKPKPPPDNVFAGATAQGVPGYVKVLSHGRGLEVIFSYAATCSDGEVALLWRGVTGLPVRKGRFHYSRPEDNAGPEVTLDGRMGKRSVSGTWHAAFSFPDPSGNGATINCDSGLVTWTLQKSLHGGRTSEGYPAVAEIKKTKVRAILISAELKCQSGGFRAFAVPYTDFPIAANGSFGDTFDDSTAGANGEQVKVHIELAGKAGKTKVTGKLHVVATVLDAAGTQTDSCDSGALTWSMAP